LYAEKRCCSPLSKYRLGVSSMNKTGGKEENFNNQVQIERLIQQLLGTFSSFFFAVNFFYDYEFR
jgi:hypothetical protein